MKPIWWDMCYLSVVLKGKNCTTRRSSRLEVGKLPQVTSVGKPHSRSPFLTCPAKDLVVQPNPIHPSVQLEHHEASSILDGISRIQFCVNLINYVTEVNI